MKVRITQLVGLEYAAVVGVPPIGSTGWVSKNQQAVKGCPAEKTAIRFHPKLLGYWPYRKEWVIIYMPNTHFEVLP
jgi:hypothetical protein